MSAVKRFEIVLTALAQPELSRVLEHYATAGFTIIRDVTGSARGEHFDDEVSGASHNHLVIATVAAEHADALVAVLRPLLVRYKGTCVISDAMLM